MNEFTLKELKAIRYHLEYDIESVEGLSGDDMDLIETIDLDSARSALEKVVTLISLKEEEN